jgi:hypothetical protein
MSQTQLPHSFLVYGGGNPSDPEFEVLGASLNITHAEAANTSAFLEQVFQVGPATTAHLSTLPASH